MLLVPDGPLGGTGSVPHHLVVGGVTGAPRCLGLPLARLLGVRQQVELHVRVRVGAVLEGQLHGETHQNRAGSVQVSGLIAGPSAANHEQGTPLPIFSIVSTLALACANSFIFCCLG